MADDGPRNDLTDAERQRALAELWADTTPVDDDYDWDTDLGAIVETEIRPYVPPPGRWDPPRPPLPPSPEERQIDLVVLGQDQPGEFVRACRAAAGFSQRDLARESGIDLTTIARIESGRVTDVKMSTLVALAKVCEVMIVGAFDQRAPLLTTDRSQRHRDNGDRLLPAHLTNREMEKADIEWWIGERVYRRSHRRMPSRTYELRNYVFQRPDD